MPAPYLAGVATGVVWKGGKGSHLSRAGLIDTVSAILGSHAYHGSEIGGEELNSMTQTSHCCQTGGMLLID